MDDNRQWMMTDNGWWQTMDDYRLDDYRQWMITDNGW